MTAHEIYEYKEREQEEGNSEQVQSGEQGWSVVLGVDHQARVEAKIFGDL